MTNNIAIRALTYNDAYKTDNNSNYERLLEDKESERIIAILNQSINIPFMNARFFKSYIPLMIKQRERDVFIASITLVEKALSMLLPKALLESINDEKKGVSHEEIAILEERLSPIVTQMINIPFIPERLEARLIHTVLGVILNRMKKEAKVDS